MAKKPTDWLPIIVILGIVALAAGWIQLPIGAVGVGERPPTAPQGTTTNPSAEFSCLDRATNSVQNQCIIRLLNSDGILKRTSTTSSGTASISNLASNTTYTVEVVNESTTNAFYPFQTTITTGLTGVTESDALLYRSIQNTRASPTVYNDDDVTSNSTAQAIGANDSKKFRIRFATATSAQDQNIFGDGVKKLLFVIDFNGIAYTKLTMTGTDNSNMAKDDVPSGHTIVDANRDSTIAFLADISEALPAKNLDFRLSVESGTQDPINSGDANCGMRVTVYDSFRYQNDAGAYLEGYRDVDDLTDLGASNWLAYINCS